jgi:hypothetical protein
LKGRKLIEEERPVTRRARERDERIGNGRVMFEGKNVRKRRKTKSRDEII